MSINEYVFTSEAIVQKADFLLPPWKSQILKNGRREPWTGRDLNTDMISGVASLKKQWIIQRESCNAVKIKLEKGCKDRQKAMAYTQDLCWSYRKGERGSPMDDNFTQIFTELTWKPESPIY